jgi:hypothetical protein
MVSSDTICNTNMAIFSSQLPNAVYSKFQNPTETVLHRAQVHRGETPLITRQASFVDGAHLVTNRNRILSSGGCGPTIGGRGRGPVESGTTNTVRRAVELRVVSISISDTHIAIVSRGVSASSKVDLAVR